MKHYVVFIGRQTGVFDNWEECEEQVKGFKGSVFKSFRDKETAIGEFQKFTKKTGLPGVCNINYPKPTNGICSDASYSTKTNVLEYRVVNIKTGKVLHHSRFKNADVTEYLTNIGEFFGLVKAVKHVIDNNLDVPVFSDSVSAIAWVEKKKVKTSLKNPYLLGLINTGEEYLKTIDLPLIVKWQTNIWGEIPADFGRK